MLCAVYLSCIAAGNPFPVASRIREQLTFFFRHDLIAVVVVVVVAVVFAVVAVVGGVVGGAVAAVAAVAAVCCVVAVSWVDFVFVLELLCKRSLVL